VRLDGVIAPICTPFDADGEIDYDALRRNIAVYNQAGLLGYVVAGSTGEAVFLGREEKRPLLEAVRAAADGRVVIAGTGAESVRETVAQTRDAAVAGADAALVITPHYYRGQMVRPETQITFYRAVADASPLPIVIYDIPQATGVDLAVEVMAELATHPNIAGIKESSPDLEKIGALIRGVPAGFPVVTGPSSKFHECLRLGATGGVVAIANALPERTQSIYDKFRANDIDGSCVAQQQIGESAGVAPKYGIQGLKYAMDLKGLYGGPSRLPLLPLADAQKAEIELLFAGL
jgi:4-hydroxy-2-oxoglutarate aldolase